MTLMLWLEPLLVEWVKVLASVEPAARLVHKAQGSVLAQESSSWRSPDINVSGHQCLMPREWMRISLSIPHIRANKFTITKLADSSQWSEANEERPKAR